MPRVSDMKERLMEAAMDLMWQNSYAAASVDAICERAGAKKGSCGYVTPFFANFIDDQSTTNLP